MAGRCAGKVGDLNPFSHPNNTLMELFPPEAQPGIMRAAAQYAVRQRILDLCTFDITRNPWRCGALFDAIITDPPCKFSSHLRRRSEHTTLSESDLFSVDGVRAGAKRLGRKQERAFDPPLPPQPRGCVYKHQVAQRDLNSSDCFPVLPLRDVQQFIPPTKPYELSALAADLVALARYLLKPGGRLVFFLPTVIDEYKELDLDSVVCDGMQVIANSLQDFGAWGRRVCTDPFLNACSFPVLTKFWFFSNSFSS
jgi:tRNA (guanine10-N2)-methyltransferase